MLPISHYSELLATLKPVAYGIRNTRVTEKRPLMSVQLDEPKESPRVEPLYSRSSVMAILEISRTYPIQRLDQASAREAAVKELLELVCVLSDCSAYWSEYDVPVGIEKRLEEAIDKAVAAGVGPDSRERKKP